MTHAFKIKADDVATPPEFTKGDKGMFKCNPAATIIELNSATVDLMYGVLLNCDVQTTEEKDAGKTDRLADVKQFCDEQASCSGYEIEETYIKSEQKNQRTCRIYKVGDHKWISDPTSKGKCFKK